MKVNRIFLALSGATIAASAFYGVATGATSDDEIAACVAQGGTQS